MTTDQFRTLAVTPQIRASAWATQNYARAIDSQPFLMLNGRRDSWYTESEARQLFELIPSPTKELKFYDSENHNIGFLDVCNRSYPELAVAARTGRERLYDMASGQIKPYSDPPVYLPKLFL